MKTALITGVTGQDGSYLAELLLEKGYEVWGGSRFSVSPNTKHIDHLLGNENFKTVSLDMQDASSLDFAVRESEPDEVYNLAAISYAPASWKIASQTMDVNCTGLARLLEAVRRNQPTARVYQASTSEMYGADREIPKTESSPFRPVHPYGVSKLAAHGLVRVYREQYGMNISAGILHNHESPRRDLGFITRKVTSYVGRLMATPSHKSTEPLTLWTLKPRRDWGYSKDYVEAMWRMLQADADDFVIGTGRDWSIEDLLETAFSPQGFEWTEHVVVSPPDWFTPDEESRFVADYTKAKQVLGWEPKTSFHDLIQMMVDHDFKEACR